MNGRDLLSAIAGIDDGIVLASGQFDSVEAGIKADRKRMRQRYTEAGAAAVICMAVFGVVTFAPKSFHISAPSDITELQPSGEKDPSEDRNNAVDTDPRTTQNGGSETDPYEKQNTSAGSETDHPSSTAAPVTDPYPPETQAPVTTNAHGSAADTLEVTSSADTSADTVPFETKVVDPPDTPREVYLDMIVDYETAREKFAHPIKSCGRSDFINYIAVIVCLDGDINASGAYCPWVDYVFANGYIELRDQDRGTEGVTPTGKAYEYQGRTFYVHLPEFNGDRIHIGYFPTGKSGIAYQALFERGTDVNEIMDLILSVEIKIR